MIIKNQNQYYPGKDKLRERGDILIMLNDAIQRRNEWEKAYKKTSNLGDRKTAMICARNYKALEGVEKALRWVLNDDEINHPLD